LSASPQDASADRARATTFAGRERELPLLREQWSESSAGRPLVVMVTGEAIGSRVVRDSTPLSEARIKFGCA
jgi:hypothetical protein